MHKVAELSERIRRNMTEFERQLAMYAESLKRARVTLNEMGAQLTAGVTLPLSATAVAAATHAKAFERSMRKARRLTQKTPRGR